jgi:demethylspheroidene O-methyltransferase
LPEVAGQARARFAQAGLADRVEVFGGDFGSDPLPQGADLVTLVRVLHDHDDARALAVLRAVRAQVPKAKLLVAEPLAAARGAEPIGAAYFGFYLLAMGSGRARTAGEIERLLAEAGFSRVRQIRTSQPMLTGLLVAEG